MSFLEIDDVLTLLVGSKIAGNTMCNTLSLDLVLGTQLGSLDLFGPPRRRQDGGEDQQGVGLGFHLRINRLGKKSR